MEKEEETESRAKDYFANLEIYTHMAHYVAKELHMRPNEILDTWCVPEMIVAFGQYANEHSNQNYEDWKHLDSETRGKIAQPSKYIVYFENE